MRSSRLLHALLLLCCADRLEAATFTVDTTSDIALMGCIDATPADCSLRGAITRAVGAVDADTVAFDIPISDPGCAAATGVCTLLPGTALPTISQFNGTAVVIDGTTQPGWQPNTNTPTQGGLNAQLKIELSGNNCAGCTGLSAEAPGSRILGLVIHGFFTDIILSNGSGMAVEGCFLGTDVTGNSASVPISQRGIVFLGNPNGGVGAASNVRIGGNLPAQRNLISGHAQSGLDVLGFNIQLLGNLIGTNAAGSAALPNANGVLAGGGGGGEANPFRYVIGDGTPGGRNLISGNTNDGIQFGTGFTNDTRVQGNFIGTDATGELALGNLGFGIRQGLNAVTSSAIAVAIGGPLAGQGNRIQFNGGTGVEVGRFSQKNAILGNRFSRNGALGISLAGVAGRDPNDVGDSDTGTIGNNLQNFPEISAFAFNASDVNLTYRVDSTTTSSSYPLRVEFFKADGDEGRDFLGSDEYTAAQAQVMKAISLPIPMGVTIGADDVIVATATDAVANTSEFSFSPATLTIQTPVASPCTTADSMFCNGFEQGAQSSLLVRVHALATSGPFSPNGDVNVTDTRGGSCTLTLRPTPTPLTSAGNCTLVNSGAPGGITVLARLNTFRSAFGAPNGQDVTTNATFTLP